MKYLAITHLRMEASGVAALDASRGTLSLAVTEAALSRVPHDSAFPHRALGLVPSGWADVLCTPDGVQAATPRVRLTPAALARYAFARPASVAPRDGVWSPPPTDGTATRLAWAVHLPQLGVEYQTALATAAHIMGGGRDSVILTCDSGGLTSPWHMGVFEGRGVQVEPLVLFPRDGVLPLPALLRGAAALCSASLHIVDHELGVAAASGRHQPAARSALLQAARRSAEMDALVRPFPPADGVLSAEPTVDATLRRSLLRRLAGIAREDLAQAAYDLVETRLCALLRAIRSQAWSTCDRLCLAGDVFAHPRLVGAAAAAGFHDVYVLPVDGFPAAAVGAALFAAAARGDLHGPPVPPHPLTPRFSASESVLAASELGETVGHAGDLASNVAAHLAEGRTVAWYSGWPGAFFQHHYGCVADPASTVRDGSPAPVTIRPEQAASVESLRAAVGPAIADEALLGALVAHARRSGRSIHIRPLRWRSEPLPLTPADAVCVFRRLRADVLVIGGQVVVGADGNGSMTCWPPEVRAAAARLEGATPGDQALRVTAGSAVDRAIREVQRQRLRQLLGVALRRAERRASHENGETRVADAPPADDDADALAPSPASATGAPDTSEAAPIRVGRLPPLSAPAPQSASRSAPEPVWELARGLPDHAPDVSVVVLDGVSAEALGRTLDSLARQTHWRIEVLIPAEAPPPADGLKADPRIRTVPLAAPGIAAGLAAAAEAATADWIVPVLAGTCLAPTAIECWWWTHLSTPEVDIWYADHGRQEAHVTVIEHPVAHFGAAALGRENFIGPAGLMRREWAQRVAERLNPVGLGADVLWELWCDCLRDGARFGHVAGPLVLLPPRSRDRTATEAGAACARALVESAAPRPDAFRECDWEDQAGAHPRTAAAIDEPRAAELTGPTRVRVLMLLSYLDVGGADLFNLRLVNSFAPERFAFTIVTTEQAEIPPWNPRHWEFARVTDDIHHLADFLPVRMWAAYLAHLIRTRRIDVVFASNTIVGYQLLPWLKARFPALSIVDYIHAAAWYWRGGGCGRASADVAGVIDRTYVTSDALRCDLVEHWRRDPQAVETVYIGTDTAHVFNPAALDRRTVRDAYRLDPDRPAVLSVGRVHAVKRPRLMLAVADELRQRLGEGAFYVFVVGSGPELEVVRREVARRGLTEVVILFGMQQDVRPFYRSADAVLICSIAEGLALTLFEAMAMGVPVVSSDVGGHREVLTPECGFLVPVPHTEAEIGFEDVFTPAEVQAFADAVERLLRQPERARQMGQAARRRAVERFDVSRATERLAHEFGRWAAVHAERRGRTAGPAVAVASDAYADLAIERVRLMRVARRAWEQCALAQQARREPFPPPTSPCTHDEELEALRSELRAIKGTRGYRLLEWMRASPVLSRVATAVGLRRAAPPG